MPTNPVAAVIDLLDETSEKVATLFAAKEHALFKTRVMSDLKKHSNFLRARSGMSLLPETRKRFGPIEQEEVSPLEQLPPVPNTKALEAEELQKEVNAVYEGFTERENDDILDSIPELVIRGVAKKAGMQVTQTEPEKINSAFVDQVKAAILEKAETKTLLDDPKEALRKAYETAKAEADTIAEQKATLLGALEKAKGQNRRPLEEKLVALEEKENEVVTRLIDLETKIGDGTED